MEIFLLHVLSYKQISDKRDDQSKCWFVKHD